MRNTFKMFGIIALAAVIGFFVAACSNPTGTNPADRPDTTPVLTTDGTWSDEHTLASATSEDWYKFDVTSGTTYYVWVKDYWSNTVAVADGYADVRLDAKYSSKTGTAIFTNSDAGANSVTTAVAGASSNFTASQTGVVYLRVSVDQTALSGGPGKYKVAVTTTNSRPAGEGTTIDTTTPTLQTTGVWTDEKTLADYDAFDWYQFTVTSGTHYYVYVKETLSSSVGTLDGYADVRLEARYDSKDGDVIFTDSDSGSNTTTSFATPPNPSDFVASKTGKVYLKVSVEQSLLFRKAGKYKVAVSTTSTRPSGEGDSQTALSSGTWSPVRNIPNDSTELWHSFYATNGVTYRIWIKDTDTTGSTTGGFADVVIDLSQGSQTAAPFLSGQDPGYVTNDVTFTASASGTVYIKVYANPDWETYGNYRITYTSGATSTRPTGW